MKVVVLSIALVLGSVVATQAGTPWTLMLPPLRTPAAQAAAEGADAWKLIVAGVDRQAELEAWRRGAVFASPEACEDARLDQVERFAAAMRVLPPGGPADAERERLTHLARQAFSRCVPSFALSDQPTASTDAGAPSPHDGQR